MQVSENIKEAYAKQYSDEIVEWRNMVARYKAQNVVELSKNIHFDKVLEVGAGEGSILKWLSDWNFSDQLHAIDISDSGVALIKQKQIKNLKEVLLFDGYHIPYADNHFDLVYCSHVLEHVEYERTLLREIQRVSKYQIFEVPIDFSPYVDKKIKHFLGYGHINIYTPALFRFLLLTENFQIMKDKSYLHSNEVLKYMYKNNKTGILKEKAKQFVLKTFPYLLGIKPSAYVVLCSKTGDKDIHVF